MHFYRSFKAVCIDLRSKIEELEIDKKDFDSVSNQIVFLLDLVCLKNSRNNDHKTIHIYKLKHVLKLFNNNYIKTTNTFLTIESKCKNKNFMFINDCYVECSGDRNFKTW